MKLDYLKEKKKLVSVVLLVVSAVLAVLILVKVTGFFAASARAENLVKTAIKQNNTDTSNMDKNFAKYKALADALKKNNLFVPPPTKQHPIKEVWGIFGNEVLIKDKWYKVGDMVGDAKIVAIGPTEATIEWDGNKKTFSPIDAAGPSQPGGPRGSRATAKSSESKGGSPQMVAVGSQGRPTVGPGGGMGKMKEKLQNMSESEKERFMTERFKNMSEPERAKFMTVMKEQQEKYMKMSEAEKIQFKSKMIEKFGGGEPGGGKRSDK